MVTSLEMKNNLDNKELAMLSSEFQSRKKSGTAMWLLWLFTGPLGGHRYYLGDKFRAIMHTLLFVAAIALGSSFSTYVIESGGSFEEALIYGPAATSVALIIPALWALIDAFFIGRRLQYKNNQLEMDIIKQILALRPTPVETNADL